MTDRPTRSGVPGTPTTLSGAALSGWVRPRTRRSRFDLAIWAAAVVAGSAIGGTLALRGGSVSAAAAPAARPAKPQAQPPAAPSSAAALGPGAAALAPGAAALAPGGAAPNGSAPNLAAPAAPAAPPPAPAPDRHAAAVAQIKDALARFVRWSHDHPGARCPDAAALGAAAFDPWGHPLQITCTDQPADEVAGAVSAGPDGIAGTRDDVESWSLGADVTEIVRGPRWNTSRAGSRHGAAPPPHGARRDPAGTAAPPIATQPAPPPPAAPTPRPAGASAGSSDNDGIPDRR